MKLLVRILLSLCSLFLGVHAHTSLQSHGFPKHFCTLSAGDIDDLQSRQAVVSQRRSSGDRRANDAPAEREEESEDEEDDDESDSSKRHTGSGSTYLSSNSGAENINALYLLSQLPSCEHLSYFSANKFIIHCVFRI